MRIMNGTDSVLRLVEYNPDSEDFKDIAELAKGTHKEISDIEDAQFEIHEGGQYLILTPREGAQAGLVIGTGGGGLIHDPGDGEPPFGA